MKTLYCATGNPGKLREFRQAAGEGFEILPAGSVDCPETGTTFEENAIQKARCYAAALTESALQRSRADEGATSTAPDTRGRRLTPAALYDGNALLFADDSGIEVDALNGAPGVYSARFAGPNADDAANNALLLEKLAATPPEQRTARYVCVIALIRGNELLGTFRGEAAGLIIDQPRGDGGFGYDPYFYFPALDQTFAQTPADVKWLHSHRGHAFRAMLAEL